MSHRARVVEMLIFIGASALGIFALGRGLNGLFESGKGVDLLWFLVLAGTIWVLFAQMGRVQDAWPRRPGVKADLGKPMEHR